MFLKRANYRHAEFRIGAMDTWPQAPGLAAWGLMTGGAVSRTMTPRDVEDWFPAASFAK